MKTYSAKKTDVKRVWYIIDAKDQNLGRLSSAVAKLLLGKNKPIFTKHVDTGDHVIVINSDKIITTGKNKPVQKKYYHHSHYPGGLKEATLKEQMEKDSTKVIFHSVRGMLPVNKLRDERLIRLRIYKDDSHKHEAQKPIEIKLEDIK